MPSGTLMVWVMEYRKSYTRVPTSPRQYNIVLWWHRATAVAAGQIWQTVTNIPTRPLSLVTSAGVVSSLSSYQRLRYQCFAPFPPLPFSCLPGGP
jgi:hypothetical protein